MNEGSDYKAYYTGKSDLIMIYKDRTLISLRFTDGKSVTIREKNDALIFETDEVTMNFNGSFSSIIILPKEGDDFIYMVMPMRLKSE